MRKGGEHDDGDGYELGDWCGSGDWCESGTLAVVLIGISMVSWESITVSTSSEGTGRQPDDPQYPPLQAAA